MELDTDCVQAIPTRTLPSVLTGAELLEVLIQRGRETSRLHDKCYEEIHHVIQQDPKRHPEK